MRCFVAIELPAAVRESLFELQGRLAGIRQRVRWTRPEQIHLTLEFLGEISDAQVGDICAATVAVAARLSPIPLEVRGVGCFPPYGAARVVWAGIGGSPDELVCCHRALEEAFAELGFALEDRPFRPHLTLGRTRDIRSTREVRTAIESVKDHRAGRFIADELVVFQSVLHPSGSTYIALQRALLQGPSIAEQ